MTISGGPYLMKPWVHRWSKKWMSYFKIMWHDGPHLMNPYWVPVGNALSIPTNVHHLLKAKVRDFINNYKWYIPFMILQAYSALDYIVPQITILVDQWRDQLLWNHSNWGLLSFKEAYNFLHPVGRTFIGPS